jgi:hypothetical protein
MPRLTMSGRRLDEGLSQLPANIPNPTSYRKLKPVDLLILYLFSTVDESVRLSLRNPCPLFMALLRSFTEGCGNGAKRDGVALQESHTITHFCHR